jgi:hypothetical protein
LPFIAVAAAADGDKDVLLLFPNETRNLRPPRSDLTSMLSLALSIRDDGGSDDDNDDDDDDDIDAGDRIPESFSLFTTTLLPLPLPLPLPLRALICISVAVARSYRFSSTHASNSAARAVHSRFGNGGAHSVERASTIGANADDDDAAAEAAAAAARRLACRAEIDDEEDDCEYTDPFQPDECKPNSASLIDAAAAEAAVAAAEVAAVDAANTAYARGSQVSASHSAAHAAASSTRKSARHARNSRSMADKATACRVRPSNSALTRI